MVGRMSAMIPVARGGTKLPRFTAARENHLRLVASASKVGRREVLPFMTVPRLRASNQSKLKVERPDADGEKPTVGIVHERKLLRILLLFLFVSLSFSTAPEQSQSQASPSSGSVGWTTMNSNSNATNYVAQNQVVASTAQDLQVA